MSQSNELTKFYQAYSNWLDAGAPDKQPFYRNYGLCPSVSDLFDINTSVKVSTELSNQFVNAGLYEVFPFNDGLAFSFYDEANNQTMHLNPKRIAWVKSHLNQGENNE